MQLRVKQPLGVARRDPSTAWPLDLISSLLEIKLQVLMFSESSLLTIFLSNCLAKVRSTAAIKFKISLFYGLTAVPPWLITPPPSSIYEIWDSIVYVTVAGPAQLTRSS